MTQSMDRQDESPSTSTVEARFRSLVERTADGVLVVAADGVIRYANPAAASLLDRPAGALVGRPFGLPIVPGETTEIDLPLRCGRVRVAEMRVVAADWEGALALLASLRDVTERKQLEDQLRQTVEELAEADRRRNEYLAILAHELRNPLAPIFNAVRLMRLDAGDPEVVARMRETIEQQARCLARLVDDLLDVSRIKSGKIQLRKEAVVLDAIVRRAVATTRALFQAKQHELALDLPATPIEFVADPFRVEQALVNLLTNAAKYTDRGGRIAVEGRAEDGWVVLRVRDNGIGITPDALTGIFEMFTQADGSFARSLGGLGIGLTLSLGLVQQHGGTLTAASEGPGRGSTFTIRLPLEVPRPVVSEPASATTATRPEAVVGPRLRLLVVDDNIPAAESLCSILRIWGHDCSAAYDGPTAIEVARAYHPDVVLLDIGMPGMDGYAVAEFLRASPELAGMRLVAMTGYGRAEDIDRSRAIGFNEHLVKPLDLDRLEAVLAELGAPAQRREAST